MLKQNAEGSAVVSASQLRADKLRLGAGPKHGFTTLEMTNDVYSSRQSYTNGACERTDSQTRASPSSSSSPPHHS